MFPAPPPHHFFLVPKNFVFIFPPTPFYSCSGGPGVPDTALLSRRLRRPDAPSGRACKACYLEVYDIFGLENANMEVYTIFGTEHPMTSKCILVSGLHTQGLGSVYHFRTWKLKDLEVCTIFGTENPRTWKCILFAGLKA